MTETRHPNITGQYGVYYVGTGVVYIDVNEGFDPLSGDYKTFAEAAIEYSWDDGNYIEVFIRAGVGQSEIWRASWHEDTQQLRPNIIVETKGTAIVDNTPVEVTAVIGNTSLSILGNVDSKLEWNLISDITMSAQASQVFTFPSAAKDIKIVVSGLNGSSTSAWPYVRLYADSVLDSSSSYKRSLSTNTYNSVLWTFNTTATTYWEFLHSTTSGFKHFSGELELYNITSQTVVMMRSRFVYAQNSGSGLWRSIAAGQYPSTGKDVTGLQWGTGSSQTSTGRVTAFYRE